MRKIKILCISDQIDPLIYSNNIKSRFNGVDLILSAGDLELEYYGFIVSSINKPLLFVFGNHNLKKLHRYRKEILPVYSKTGVNIANISLPSYGSTYIGDKVVKIKSLLIAGLGGSMRYNNGTNQFSEFEMAMKILKIFPHLLFNRLFRGRWLDILLTHAPPKDLGDREDRCHRGFKVFRTFIRLFEPQFHLHGHIHLNDLNYPREIQFYKTRIINIFKHQILEIEAN